MTKLPKLEAAVQIVPEWTGLDTEIKSLEKSVSNAINNNIIPQDQQEIIQAQEQIIV